MPKDLPSPEVLRKLLKYDPETGKLFWRKRPVEMFSTFRAFKVWNSRFHDREAFAFYCADGYRCGTIFCETYKAHRVIWSLVNGKSPVGEIDHVNGQRDDNRIENLRDTNSAGNNKNSAIPSNNTSGVIGVSWFKRDEKWMSQITVDGKKKHIGLFASKDDAIAARKLAEKKYGFHENHGEVRETYG